MPRILDDPGIGLSPGIRPAISDNWMPIAGIQFSHPRLQSSVLVKTRFHPQSKALTGHCFSLRASPPAVLRASSRDQNFIRLAAPFATDVKLDAEFAGRVMNRSVKEALLLSPLTAVAHSPSTATKHPATIAVHLGRGLAEVAHTMEVAIHLNWITLR